MDENKSLDMNSIPAVSVLMPVYNGEKYLSEAIDSILNQTFADFELIIINDGSTDGTLEILRKYTQQNKRIVLHNQTNQGLIAALNKGIKLARGKYIARMDADDISFPERLALQVGFLENHPEIGVLGSGARIMNSSGVTYDTLQHPTQHNVLQWCLCFFCPIVHPTVIMRRQVVVQVGGYGAMQHAEDYDLWCRLSCVTRLSNLKDVLLYLRQHDSNVSNVHALEQRKNSIRISSLMMSRILNEEISMGVVKSLWEHKFQTVHDVRSVAQLVCKLYKTIVSNGELSIVEKRAIRRDAAMRLFALIRPWALYINIWGILARAFYLDPFLALRAFKRQLMRRMSQK